MPTTDTDQLATAPANIWLVYCPHSYSERIGWMDSCYYVLNVPAGTYESDTLIGLVTGVLRHRCWHWRQGHGWVD